MAAEDPEEYPPGASRIGEECAQQGGRWQPRKGSQASLSRRAWTPRPNWSSRQRQGSPNPLQEFGWPEPVGKSTLAGREPDTPAHPQNCP
eukprot:14713073-Heterocapsa_arctica.AAC.1